VRMMREISSARMSMKSSKPAGECERD